MKLLLKFLQLIIAGTFSLVLLGILVTAGLYIYLAPDLPDIETLKDVQFQVPLRVYSRDGLLIAEFGEKRRIPIKYEDIPEPLVRAVLAAEDARFFEHPGVDYQGLLRAVLHLIRTGEKGQGGSTITMQVARNFFLSREKTYIRKLSEIFLALKIERELSKQEILALYFNKIYLGQRSYGFAAAAQVYYGRAISELDLAQIAMIAGLPKAPSRFNPIADPERAVKRRNYVLRRMHELDYIDGETYARASSAPVTAELHGLQVELDAPYVAEMARAEMVQRYGNEAYTSGYKVYTTISSQHQRFAMQALRKALLEYDKRHGYRGAEQRIDIDDPVALEPGAFPPEWLAALNNIAEWGGLRPALVLALENKTATVLLKDGRLVKLDWEGIEWARRYIDENRRGPAPESFDDIVAAGDIVRIQKRADGKWQLTQLPAVQGALIALRPDNAAITALMGGFDYYHSKFNRATQAERQPGSSFKPFIYSAALENGFTTASIINDAPVVFEDAGLESTWRPENYSGKFYGPTRLRVALTKSRNLVSIRILRDMGIRNAIDHVARFGFDTTRLPRNLSLALGSGSVRPLELARGYAVFANGGFRVEPHLITHITDAYDRTVYRHVPATVCHDCTVAQHENLLQAMVPTLTAGRVVPYDPQLIDDPAETPFRDGVSDTTSASNPAPRVITPQNRYLVTSMMRDVIRYGTGRGALDLGRQDLAGKTGTTNDQHDAWFAGFNNAVVTVCWVGFDESKPLGSKETGARAALPMWKHFMANALRGLAESAMELPAGLVTVRIDPETGLLADAVQPGAIFETFRSENVPGRTTDKPLPGPDAAGRESGIPEALF